MRLLFLKFEQKIEVKGHAGILPVIPGPPGGVQNVINEATDFAYGE